jgi:uncharacterized membrane protein YcfT
MTITEIAQVVTATAALIAAVASVVALFKIRTVHQTFNSRMSEFLKLTAETSLARGRKEAEDERR